MPDIRRRKRVILLTRFIGLLVIAGLTVGVFVAFQLGGSRADVGPNVEELFNDAGLSLSRGDNVAALLRESRVKCEKAIQADPKSPRAQKLLLRLAHLQREVGNARMAFRYLDRIINSYPESNVTAEARYMMGRIWESDVGDLDRALVSYRAVVSAYLPMLEGNGGSLLLPEHVRRTPSPSLRETVFNALVAAASVGARLGEYDAAVDTLRRAIERFPDHNRIEMLQMRRADILADHLGRRLEAIGIWARLLSENPESVWAPVAERRRQDEW